MIAEIWGRKDRGQALNGTVIRASNWSVNDFDLASGHVLAATL